MVLAPHHPECASGNLAVVTDVAGQQSDTKLNYLKHATGTLCFKIMQFK
jgi:hypothetical protein